MAAPQRAAAAPAAAEAAAPDLERELRPGEVSLDELERAFRETAVEIARRLAVRPSRAGSSQQAEGCREARAAKKPAAKRDDAEGDKVANQSIRVNVDTLEHLMTMVSELVLTRNQLLEIAAATRTPNSRCRCSGSPTSPPSCRKAS